MRILYDLTYGTRGTSGIPRDSISIANMLLNQNKHQVSLLLFPKTFVVRKKSKNVDLVQSAISFGNATRKYPGRSSFPGRLELFLNLLQAFSVRSRVNLLQLSESHSIQLVQSLKLRIQNAPNVFVAQVSWFARFSRFLPFKLKLKNFELYLQQQVDPISVNKGVIHVVRLHDIIPITHPHLFDELAVKVFAKSLTTMLRQDIIWIFDTKATEQEFLALFGGEKKTFVIPCVIDAALNVESNNKTNSILMVNTIEPRKRVELAISAFKLAKLNKEVPRDWTLKIAGSPGWQQDHVIKKLIDGEYGDDVIFFNSPSNDEVVSLYKTSRILLSLPIAEGFGIPPLEGLAAGCIPVVSDIPQHRETLSTEMSVFVECDSVLEISKRLGEAVKLTQKNEKNRIRLGAQYVDDRFSYRVIQQKWQSLLDSIQREHHD